MSSPHTAVCARASHPPASFTYLRLIMLPGQPHLFINEGKKQAKRKHTQSHTHTHTLNINILRNTSHQRDSSAYMYCTVRCSYFYYRVHSITKKIYPACTHRYTSKMEMCLSRNIHESCLHSPSFTNQAFYLHIYPFISFF